jgi:nitronate monooxygenase
MNPARFNTIPHMQSNLPPFIEDQLRLPLIVAPMFLVSGPEMVVASCKAGVMGSFPSPNARPLDQLEQWIQQINDQLQQAKEGQPANSIAPWAINLVRHSSYPRRDAELELVVKHKVPIVITALGSPKGVVEAVHSYGGSVIADVNSVSFARKAVESGVDGLILVSAGAGGHTGQISGFAFIDAVRQFWGGMLVLAGGISTGRGIRAAEVLGADLVAMGTRFIPVEESMAQDGYRQMLIEATCEDLILSNSVTGVYANWLKPSLIAAGYDLNNMRQPGTIDLSDTKSPWRDTWSAGQGVGTITKVESIQSLVDQLMSEYLETFLTDNNQRTEVNG